MSMWACGNLLSGSACHTNPGQSLAWPITLNIYSVQGNNEPGTLLKSVSSTFKIPFRPTPSASCPINGEGVQGWGPKCFHGKTHNIVFHTTGVTLPQKVIMSIAFNTTDYGYHPTHAPDMGEDSLNVATTENPATAPSVGSDPLIADGYLNSSTAYWYSGLGTPGTFSLAGPANYLEELQPAIKVSASPTTALVAIGDSLAYGYKEQTFNEHYEPCLTEGPKGANCEPPSDFEGGYVGTFATKLAKVEKTAGNVLETINLGCPGETTGGMLGNGALGSYLESLRTEPPFVLGLHAPCGYQNVDGFRMKTELNGASELENAVGLLESGVKVSAVTLNMGSNDELETVGKCESPTYDSEQGFVGGLLECIVTEAGPSGHEYQGGLFDHILTNDGEAIATLRDYGYTGPVAILGFYNPQTFLLPGSNKLQKELNETFEYYVYGLHAFGPGVSYGNPFPLVNPETGSTTEEKTICKYTEECNPTDIAFNEATKHEKAGDIHPTKLGYQRMGEILWTASGL